MSSASDSNKKQNDFGWMRVLSVVFLTIGIFARLAPLSNVGGRILRQYPTEDGYLMLTIARNIALGSGMSVSAGTLPTNGTQPLATFIWSGVFWLFGGERTPSVLVVQLLQLCFALLSAFLLSRLALRLISDESLARRVSWLAPALWLASPVALPHTMNCLETGLYILCVLVSLLLFTTERESWSWGRTALFGGVLGLTFLARMDATFLIGAICLIHLIQGPSETRSRRLAQSMVMGLASIAVASPWLIYNVTEFGHVIPISGQSESMGAAFGENKVLALTVLLEYAFVVLPIPMVLGENPVVAALCLVLLVAVVLPSWRFALKELNAAGRSAFWVIALFTLALVSYYGFVFGAAWFVNRYFAPLSAWFALLLVIVGIRLLLESRHAWLQRMTPSLLGLVALVAVGLHVRVFQGGDDHQHFQVVEWVNDNVAPEEWVAAPQSGTLGFFHDRSLNLDGKVSLEALVARQEERIPEYALSKGTRYFADWQGIHTWVELPALKGRVELVVHSKEDNLAVIRVLDDAALGERHVP